MSVDTVNQALTRVRVRTHSLQAQGTWSCEGYDRRLLFISCMRDYLMQEDAAGFVQYVQMRLGSHPDTMNSILEDLFEEVLGNPDAMWEEFEKELHAT